MAVCQAVFSLFFRLDFCAPSRPDSVESSGVRYYKVILLINEFFTICRWLILK